MMEQEEEEGRPLEPLRGVFQDVFSAVKEAPKWIVEDLLPVGLTFVAAPPKALKSTLTMACAAMVAGFKCEVLPPFLRNVHRPGPVMVFSAEASAGELRHMLEKGLRVKGKANESILIADNPWGWRLDDAHAVAQWEFWLAERAPKLCIIDPLIDFHQTEEKNAGDMVRLLRPIREWAVDHEAAVLIVHHTRKPSDDKGKYDALDMRGSGAIFGKADGVLMLTPRGEGKTFMTATFKRGATWERTLKLNAYDSTGPAVEIMGQVDELTLKALKAGVSGPQAIADQLHCAKRVVEEALEKLKRNGMYPERKKAA